MRFVFTISFFFIVFFSVKANPIADVDTIGIRDYFAKYSISLDKVENLDLYISVYKWKGTPYVLGGSSSSGIDCSNLVKQIYGEVYQQNLAGTVINLHPQCTPLEFKDMAAEGDLVFFKINKSVPSHVGIYLQHGLFAHATVSGGVMISSLDENYYKKCFHEASRPNADIFFSEYQN